MEGNLTQSSSCRFYERFCAIITIPVFGLLYTLTTISVIFALVFSCLGLRHGVRTVIFIWANALIMIMGKRIVVKGKENIRKGTKYLLVANHSSLFDIPAIMSFYPGVAWFGREYLLRIPVFGHVLKRLHYVPMKQATVGNTRKMMDQLIEHSIDHTVAIFPEGTRTSDGQINRFRKGFIHLLKSSNLQLLPVTLIGFFHLKPKNRSSIHFHSPLQIVIHEPIPRDELLSFPDELIIERVKDVIESVYY